MQVHRLPLFEVNCGIPSMLRLIMSSVGYGCVTSSYRLRIILIYIDVHRLVWCMSTIYIYMHVSWRRQDKRIIDILSQDRCEYILQGDGSIPYACICLVSLNVDIYKLVIKCVLYSIVRDHMNAWQGIIDH